MKQSTLCGHGASAQTNTSGTTNLKNRVKIRLFWSHISTFSNQNSTFHIKIRLYRVEIRFGLN